MLQKWFNIISKIIALITYHAQICPKLFLTVMTPTYIAFILTKNWFGQTWPNQWFNIISKIIALITYHAQICPKLFLTVMTPTYIAFILTKNWFGQTWAGMGN